MFESAFMVSFLLLFLSFNKVVKIQKICLVRNKSATDKFLPLLKLADITDKAVYLQLYLKITIEQKSSLFGMIYIPSLIIKFTP